MKFVCYSMLLTLTFTQSAFAQDRITGKVFATRSSPSLWDLHCAIRKQLRWSSNTPKAMLAFRQSPEKK